MLRRRTLLKLDVAAVIQFRFFINAMFSLIRESIIGGLQ